jgi:hypothetical protein
MKRLLMAATIACGLSMTSMAGEIPSGGAPQPPPQQTTSPTGLGDISSDGGALSVSEAAISALLTALGLASI